MRKLTLIVLGLVLVSSTAHGGTLRSIPVRWCAVAGSPAVENPQGAPPSPFGGPEPDTDNVLWRRFERASDHIWIPGASLTFRSGITAEIRDRASFPILRDPCPPIGVAICSGGAFAGRPCGTGTAVPDCGAGNTCSAPTSCPSSCDSCAGAVGDLLSPRLGRLEYNAMLQSCEDSWEQLARDNGAPALQGFIAVNIGSFVDATGRFDGLKGIAQESTVLTVSGASLPFEEPCDLPPSDPVASATGGSVVAMDNQRFAAFCAAFNCDPDDDDLERNFERMLAHEFGHVLHLTHGNGLDDDGDGVFDQLCDDDESLGATPTSFMSSSSAGMLSIRTTALQARKATAIAPSYAGGNLDPAGVIVPGSVFGDYRTDPLADVVDGAIDLTRVAALADIAADTVTVLFFLRDRIPLFTNTARQYAAFLDLDGDAATGGSPTGFFGSQAAGIEIVAEVEVPNALPDAVISARLYRFDGSAFVACDPAVEPLCARIRAAIKGVELTTDAIDFEEPFGTDHHVVWLRMPRALLGTIDPEVRFQAVAFRPGQATVGSETDRLPGEAASTMDLRPRPPRFPGCGVSPDPALAGQTAVFSATGLLPSRTVKVFLGDRFLGMGPSDANGNASVSLAIPADATPGLRLVTMGVVGTAMTADCPLEIAAFEDCNHNGVPDADDISGGGSQDIDSSGVPDECELNELPWQFSGIAQGGSISLTFGGFTAVCTVTVPTLAGQSAAQVAAAMAAAINADACAISQGVTASAANGLVRVAGFRLIEIATAVQDPGLEHGVPILPVPALSGWGLALSILALLVAAIYLQRRRALRR